VAEIFDFGHDRLSFGLFVRRWCHLAAFPHSFSCLSALNSKRCGEIRVFKEANETVGKIDDLIVTPTEKVPFAVLPVGGLLGIGTKYVVVSFSSLQVKDKKMVLPGATKDSLTALPDFKCNTSD
jgi:PRC-barrel domain.